MKSGAGSFEVEATGEEEENEVLVRGGESSMSLLRGDEELIHTLRNQIEVEGQQQAASHSSNGPPDCDEQRQKVGIRVRGS